MKAMEPSRWDDYVLAGLLLVIGVPRAILALLHDHPLGVEGTLSLLCVAAALLACSAGGAQRLQAARVGQGDRATCNVPGRD